MERIIALLLLLCIMSIGSPNFVKAEPTTTTATQTQTVKAPEPTDCVKTFPIPYDKLFYLTLAATNEYNYQIKEIQSKSGYIIFETGYRKYLASIVYVSSTKSMLKITPYSGNYDFPLTVIQNMFKYVELYQDKKF